MVQAGTILVVRNNSSLWLHPQDKTEAGERTLCASVAAMPLSAHAANFFIIVARLPGAVQSK